jgi:N-acetyl-D-muramate 6-phosphate phosphatase
VRALLARLDASKTPWGIVTNKPVALALALVAKLKLNPGALLGGDSLAQKKPDPAPLLAACQRLGVAPAHTWMVGDDPRDIQAGHAAGCAVTIACAYGYMGGAPPVASWGASWVAHSVAQLRL